MAWSKAINFICVCAFILSGGCSAAKEIAASADHAATLAHSVYTQAQWITTHSGEPETIKAATGIQADALAILAETSDITVAVSGVKDIQSAYITALIFCAGAAGSIALAFIFWQSGAGIALRALAGFIPRRTQNEAALARQMLSDDPTTAREFVAMKRGSDPLFNAAFKESAK